jgi:hypothetical protein
MIRHQPAPTSSGAGNYLNVLSLFDLDKTPMFCLNQIATELLPPVKAYSHRFDQTKKLILPIFGLLPPSPVTIMASGGTDTGAVSACPLISGAGNYLNVLSLFDLDKTAGHSPLLINASL